MEQQHKEIKMDPILTIGMATYDDYDGVFFTINSIILHHPEILDKIEFIVVDNNPNSDHGKQVEKSINTIKQRKLKYQPKYIPYTEVIGAANAKNKIFDEASGKFIMSVDCHVLFPQGCLKRLVDYLEANPDTSDILHGPLLGEDGGVITHINYQWRTEMLGTWGSAWKYKNIEFSVINDDNNAKFVSLKDGKTEIFIHEFSDKSWVKHEQRLQEIGCQKLGTNIDEHPFEIPAHGMGMFICSKKYWPNFNLNVRGFGGEEFYIQRKHIANGYKVVLLPFLRWLHRFGRPNGVKFPLTLWNKVRNYVLQFKEMNWDLQEIYNHFVVERSRISQEEWEYLVQNTESAIHKPTYEYSLMKATKTSQVYDLARTVQTSLNKNLDTIKKYADKSKICVDYSVNGQTAVAVLNSDCKNIFIHNADKNNIFLKRSVELSVDKNIKIGNFTEPDYQDIDLLVVDITTEGDVIDNLLVKLHTKGCLKKYVIINNSKTFQNKSISNKAGIMIGVKKFLRQYPEFIVVEFVDNQNGLVVLSCDKSDRKPLPAFTEMASNLFTAAKDFVSDGGQLCDKQEYEQRLAMCAVCQYRNNKNCSLCGCFIEAKAKIKSSSCPIDRWNLE
jgi:hypothetical protein